MKKILFALTAFVCLFMCSCEGDNDGKFTTKSIQGVWVVHYYASDKVLDSILVIDKNKWFNIINRGPASYDPQTDKFTNLTESHWAVFSDDTYGFSEDAQAILSGFSWNVVKIDNNTASIGSWERCYRTRKITYKLDDKAPYGIRVYGPNDEGEIVELTFESYYENY